MFNSMGNPMTMNPSFPTLQQQQQNQYMSRLSALQQPTMQRMEITRVNGRNGAEAFLMPPNSQILLLDETAPIVWLKQTDGAGYATATPYTIAPLKEAPAPDYGALEGRIRRLEELLNGKSDVTANGETGNAHGGEQPHAVDAAVPTV